MCDSLLVPVIFLWLAVALISVILLLILKKLE